MNRVILGKSEMYSRTLSSAVAGLFLIVLSFGVFADQAFDDLFSKGKYQEAVEYADQKIPAAERTPDIWVKLAKANNKLGHREKALACYMVSYRSNPNHYESLLGAAGIYNSLNQPVKAMEMAKKALDQKFTGEASWEYASASIALKKPDEAKEALEKVIETDPANIVANRELGLIYFNDKEYSKAIPLLEKSYNAKADAEVAYKIGTCYQETGNSSSAITYLEKAVSNDKAHYEAGKMLARSYYSSGMHEKAANEYARIEGKVGLTAEDYYNMARSYEKTGNGDKAIDVYRKAIREYGASKDEKALAARYKVGKADMEKKSYSSAVSNFLFVKNADKKAETFKDIYFLLADAYLASGKRMDAIECMKDVIDMDASNIEAYARLGDMYKKENMEKEAKETYEKMMSLSPNDPEVYLILGKYKLEDKQYKEAEKLFIKANTLEKSAKALEGIAVCALKLGDWVKARDAAESAVQLDATLIPSREVLYQAYFRDKNYKEAASHLEILVTKKPNELKYWEDLAECWDKTGNIKKRAEADTKIVTLDKKNTEARLRLARYFMDNKKKDEAYSLFKELVVLTPKDTEVFKNLFLIAREKGDVDVAISYAKRYLALNPDDAQMHRDVGNLYYSKKDFDSALESYRTALKKDPGIKGFYKRYAEIVLKKGQQDEVINALNGVIKSGDADEGTYTTLGSIYYGKENYSQAEKMFDKALQLNPKNNDALLSLADCKRKLGKYSEAVITYEQVVMMEPKNAEAYKALGQIYETQKKEKEAVKAYKKYLELESDQDIAEKVGDYAFRMKNWKEAEKYLSMVKGEEAKAFTHLYNYGVACFHNGNYKKVIPVMEGLRKRNPNLEKRKVIYRTLAISYEKEKKYNEAVAIYGGYLTTKGVRDEDASFKRAYLQEKTDPEKARGYYLANTKSYPDDYRNYLQLGLMYSKDKTTLSKAAYMLEKAGLKADDKPEIWLKIAEVYNKLGKDKEELEAYEKYIKASPENAQDVKVNLRMGEILVNQGNYTQAIISLETAKTVNPNNLKILNALSEAYLKTNRPQEALKLLTKAKNIDNDNPDIREKLAKVYTMTGDIKGAIKEMEELIKLERNNDNLMRYAKMLYSAEKYRDAESTIEDIRATDPANLEALMLKSKIMMKKEKYDEAIEVFKEISYIEAEYPPALYGRAEAYMKMGKVLWAQKFYQRALRADPEYGLAELGLAKVARTHKKKDEMIERVKKAYKLDPKNPEIKEAYEKVVGGK